MRELNRDDLLLICDYSAKLARSEDDADEIAQMVMVEAMKITSEPRDLAAYLRTIVHRTACRFYGKRQVATYGDADHVISGSENQCFETLLTDLGLPDLHREIMMLRYQYDQTLAEIQQRLNLSRRRLDQLLLEAHATCHRELANA